MSEWKTVTIKESSYLKGRIGWQGLKASEFINIGPYLVTGTNFVKGKIKWEECYHISEKRYNEAKYIQLKNHDLLVTKDGTIGKIVYVEKCPNKAVLNSGIFLLRCNNNSYNHRFLYHVLNSDIFDKFLGNNLNGSTINHLYQYVFENFTFSLPPLPQQRKIARILTTVDNIIEKTEAAIGKYRAIKQGLLHDLFTRGIDVSCPDSDTYGKLRPKFEHAPQLYKESELGWIPREWEVKRLGEVAENLDEKRIPLKQGDRELRKGNIPYYGASGIIDYVDDFIFNEPLILLGEDGENVISRNLPLVFKIQGKSWVNNHAHVLRPNVEINIDFLTEFLESLNYSDIISGSAQPKINQNNLNKKTIIFPQKIEQSMIVSKTISINQKIRNEQKTLNKYQKLKQGLMQDLLTGKKEVFPDPEDYEDREH